MQMLMKARPRRSTGWTQGPGGRRCTCCDLAQPGQNRRARRQVKRSERQRWRHEVSL